MAPQVSGEDAGISLWPLPKQGVAMLSTVLIDQRRGWRTFKVTNCDLMERKYDAQIKVVFETIRELMAPPRLPTILKMKIGFQLNEPKAGY